MVEAASSTQPDNKEISEMSGEESTVEQSAFSTQSTVVGEQSAVEKKRQQLADNEGAASSTQPDIQELINEMSKKADSIQSTVDGEQSSVEKKRQLLAKYEDFLKEPTQKVVSYLRVDLARYQPLMMACFDNNMKAVEDFINKNLETILDARIDEVGSTIFHLIVQFRALEALTEKLVSKVNANSLVERRSINSFTALHIAAAVGNTKAVKLLVKKNKDLLTIKDTAGLLPLSCAIGSGRYKATVEYLLSDPEARIENFAEKFPRDSDDVLFRLIKANHIDLAFGFLDQNPNLADRGRNPEIWKKTIYLLAGKDTGLPIPGIKSIHEQKLMHVQTLQIVRLMIAGKTWTYTEALESLKKPVLRAAKLGNYMFVEEILKTDDNECNILHLAGKLVPSTRVPGAVLQMQRELQWFKFPLLLDIYKFTYGHTFLRPMK
ncbi:hypothetical protein EZV62_003322 [Acer yangbiense]|uniref:Uncharacterized protein n=1 Tax=Acer yangbiense TaxID=1000413 RepID=A0A5C7IGD6_9ROSI|nr:hypothetical protein EZV62_003322 [Acer yangbiense]